jgi:hypothetical protein
LAIRGAKIAILLEWQRCSYRLKDRFPSAYNLQTISFFFLSISLTRSRQTFL